MSACLTFLDAAPQGWFVNTSDTPSGDLLNIEVFMTMIDGQVEYCANGFKTFCPAF